MNTNVDINDEVWVVAHQIPVSKIVGIYISQESANSHESEYNQFKHATLIYPCKVYMLCHQSGYNKNLIIKP